jgi:hypothetical protein
MSRLPTVYSIKKAQALLFVLDSFACGCASAAADNNTSSHARSGSHRTTNNSSGYATGNGTHGGSDGHARDIITQVTRAIRVVFGLEFIKDVDDRSRIGDFRYNH